MSAAAILVLIFLFIGLGLALYYTILCLQLRSKKPRPYKSGDLGPLLEVDPSDVNGNNEPEAILVDPRKTIDEPDKCLDDDSMDDTSLKNPVRNLLKNVSFQTTPQCASKDPKPEAVFLPIEDEPSTNTSKPVMVPVRRDLKPTFMALKSDTQSHDLSNSYEEDGLLVPRNTVAVASMIPAALLLEEHLMKDHRQPENVDKSLPLKHSPKKHVKFTTTPEDGTSIDEASNLEDRTCTTDRKKSELDKPVFRLNTINIPVEETTPENQSKFNQAPYPTDSPFPTPAVNFSHEDNLENIVMNPIYEQMNVPLSAGSIGWVAPEPPKEPFYEEVKPEEKSSMKENLIDSNPTVVKVFLPNDDSSDPSDAPDASSSESDTSSSDPEVTEYSFQTGPLVPSTACVLANEMGSYSDPVIPNIVTLHYEKTTDRPPTPSTDGRSSSRGSSLLEEQTIDADDDFTEHNILGTPPKTPPPEDNICSGFVISNLNAEEVSPRTDDDDHHHRPVIEKRRERSGSSSSSMSSTSNSSTSSSSTNGSYRIQNLDKIDNSSDKIVNDKNTSKIPRLK